MDEVFFRLLLSFNRLPADRQIDRGAGIRGGDRESAEQPGGEVGRDQRDAERDVDAGHDR